MCEGIKVDKKEDMRYEEEYSCTKIDGQLAYMVVLTRSSHHTCSR